MYSDEYDSSFGNGNLHAFSKSGIKTLPNEFLKNVALSLKEHPKLLYDLSWGFAGSKIEILPEDLFKPFENYIGSFYALCLFQNCSIKDKFPPKYQPLAWKREEDQGTYTGIFAGCKTIPNYDEIPHVLRSYD